MRRDARGEEPFKAAARSSNYSIFETRARLVFVLGCRAHPNSQN